MAYPRERRLHGKFSGGGAGSVKIHGDGYGEWSNFGPRWSQRGGRGDDRRVATSWRSKDWSQSSWRNSSPSWSTDVTLPGDGDPMADVKAKPAWARMAPIPGGEVSNRVCLDFLAAQLEEAATGVALGS